MHTLSEKVLQNDDISSAKSFLTMLYIETENRLLTSGNNTFKTYIHHQHQENLIVTGKHMCQTK